MNTRRWTRLAAAVVLSAVASAPLSAQQTFQACYVPDVGAMYLINLDGLPTSCLSETHQEITWTEGGGVTDHGALAGLADDDHPEYVREGEAAAGDLGGTYPDPSVAGLRGNAIAATAPSDGQVLTWSDPASAWEPQAAPSGVTDHGALAGLSDDDHAQYVLADGVRDVTDGFAVTGAFGTGVIPVAGSGTRLMWYPGKAAFRAGHAAGTQWDDANVGDYSVALGRDVVASGNEATALGSVTTASGYRATALGHLTDATGERSTAIGSNATASGYASTAMGANTTASGFASMAAGSSTTASELAATATGYRTTASGYQSTAMGWTTTASGLQATAMGLVTTAQANASLVIGRYNVIEGAGDSWVATDPLFVAGNGGSTASPSNALTLYKNGNMTIAGTLTESSDRRLKVGIEPLGAALEGLRSIRPVRFRFREGTGHPEEAQIGLIAQEVRDVFPDLVGRDGEGFLSLAYPKLTAVLLKGLQEQQAQIEEQGARIAEQRARIEAQQARIEAGDEAMERMADRLERVEARLRRLQERRPASGDPRRLRDPGSS